MNLMYFDGAPCAVKAACTVLGGGKSGDNFKGLPIAIRRKVPGHEAAYSQIGVITKQAKISRVYRT